MPRRHTTGVGLNERHGGTWPATRSAGKRRIGEGVSTGGGHEWRSGSGRKRKRFGQAPYASLTAATSLVSELLASPNRIEHLGL